MIQKPKGTNDVIGGGANIYLENLFQALMDRYSYEYIRTPIFEASELFHRGVGETTDIVTKETYDFVDRGNRKMTLRPEGTAGVVRSYIENKIYGNPSIPFKCWYYGPMFRYERPQSGRFREHYQFGVEIFGSDDPLVDAEVISIPVNIYKILGLKGVKVNINSLGDEESRNNYRNALKKYFKPHLKELCEDCRNRFDKNPLRILDCKVDVNKKAIKTAPIILDYLNKDSKLHFEKVQDYLTAMNIEYHIKPNIVRGLDYYTHTVFEVEADIEGFGSQNVLCGGGRYDGLVKSLDGPDTSGVGFALGMERLITALELSGIKFEDIGIDAYVVPLEEADKKIALALTNDLRLNGFIIDMDYMSRNLKSNFKQADRLKAKFIIIIGEEEIKNGTLKVKCNKTKKEEVIEFKEIMVYLHEKLSGCDCGECKH